MSDAMDNQGGERGWDQTKIRPRTNEFYEKNLYWKNIYEQGEGSRQLFQEPNLLHGSHKTD